jgi:N-acetylmuramoyl-L-alanine amidase
MRKVILTTVLAVLGAMFSPSVEADELECLALNIYHEARGEPVEGKIAVAAVTVNRAKHDKFPDGICEVVYQKGQFSWVPAKPKVNRNGADMASARTVAANYLSGLLPDPTDGALFFHSTGVKPQWKLRLIKRIGSHYFYGYHTK